MTIYVTGTPMPLGTGGTHTRDRAGGAQEPAFPSRAAAREGKARRAAEKAAKRGVVLPEPPRAVQPAPFSPRADCTADGAGGLTFDVRLTDGTGVVPACADAPSVTGELAGSVLELRLRGGKGSANTVRLPLVPGAAEGTLRAVLPSTMPLPEGRWDVHLILGAGQQHRLLPGVHDLRSLIGRVPHQGRTWLGVRIPYTTKFGNLTIRSWLRWPHAEAGHLRIADGVMVLDGRLFGARLEPSARLEAHARDAEAVPVCVPLIRDEDPREGGAGARAGDPAARGARKDGAGADGMSADGMSNGMSADGMSAEEAAADAERPPGFTVRLPLAALPSGTRIWDLWVRPSADDEPVRLARILDDVPDKKQIFSYPPQGVTLPEGEKHTVRPYYTLDNDLSVRVTCIEAV